MTEYGLVDGPAPVNGQPQTKMADILAEIIASVELSRLSDFQSDESFITLWLTDVTVDKYYELLAADGEVQGITED